MILSGRHDDFDATAYSPGVPARQPQLESDMTDPNVLKIAKACHEVNRAYCHATEATWPRSWEAAPEDQRLSAIAGVEAHLDNPTQSPADCHALWLATKLGQGWKYGEVKDLQAKTHPCMVDYNLLPKQQRAKDFLFTAVVRQLAEILMPGLPQPALETRGQYRVGMSFNPSAMPEVDEIKRQAAALIDMVERMPMPAEAGPQSMQANEIMRLRALAMTAFEDGAMWAVKALTKRPPRR